MLRHKREVTTMATKKRSDEKVAASAAAFEKVRGKWAALTS
jgi:hypothetical protein